MPAIKNLDPLLTIKEAAEYTRFGESTIRRRIYSGVIPATHFGPRRAGNTGGTVRVRVSALDHWLNEGDPS